MSLSRGLGRTSATKTKEGSNSDLHDDVTEQKKQGLGRASATKTKEGSNSDLHDDVTEQKKQSTRGLDHASATKTKEGSNSDLHDDVTEQKKQSTRGLGRASATKTKNVHVDVIEPKGTRGLGRVAATNSPSDSPNNDVPCASMCDENWLYADSQYKKSVAITHRSISVMIMLLFTGSAASSTL
ncbi:uncharacterized protein LOC135345712 isoform X2 [Halichondria panicea]|uniref:uncharacterized protein LOC135345712 isoform X2 n=1 Tax=Halichondria panicea TaxID=6063 RepID=UPI00312B2C17